MLFNSFEFAIFLPLVFIIYWFICQYLLCNDYNTIRQCIQHANFTLRWLNAAPEKPFLDSKIMFDIYIVKKYKTLCRLVGICK